MAEQMGPATASGSAAPEPPAVSTGAGAAPAQPSTAVTGSDPERHQAPFVSQVPGTPVIFPSYHGRTASWTAVALIWVASLAGGLALILGPIWWLFWAAAALAVIGLLMCAAIRIFDDWY